MMIKVETEQDARDEREHRAIVARSGELATVEGYALLAADYCDAPRARHFVGVLAAYRLVRGLREAVSHLTLPFDPVQCLEGDVAVTCCVTALVRAETVMAEEIVREAALLVGVDLAEGAEDG